MYALVEIKSKQYKVKEGDEILVDLQDKANGESISFSNVLAIVNDGKASFGTPYLASANVQAKVIAEKVLDDKVRVYKYNRRKGYRKTQGHRQGYTKILIEKINA